MYPCAPLGIAVLFRAIFSVPVSVRASILTLGSLGIQQVLNTMKMVAQSRYVGDPVPGQPGTYTLHNSPGRVKLPPYSQYPKYSKYACLGLASSLQVSGLFWKDPCLCLASLYQDDFSGICLVK